MVSLRPFLPLLAVLLCPGTLLADEIAIDLSGDSVRLAYANALERRGLEVDLSVLHNEDDGDVGGVGLHVLDLAGASSRVRVGLGGKLVYFDADEEDGGALALGGHLRLYWPHAERFELSATVHYAPDVVAFGDAEEYLEAGLSAGYRVLDRATVYLGVRKVRAEFESFSSVTLDSGLHAGFHFSF